jgi:hypothetical protein
MAQEINVVAMRKQITTKLKTLEDSVKAYHDAYDKLQSDEKIAREKFEKEHKAWKIKVSKGLIKSIKPENVDLGLNGYRGRYDGATIYLKDVDLSSFGNEPKFTEDFDYRSERSRKVNDLLKAIPNYYDQYGRQVSSDSVIFHFKKALDLLDVLPQGTTTITVKDFNFLIKF